MPLQIVRATKKDAKARLALVGPTGSGKTYTALEIALGMARLEEIALIDTEHKSSEKYVPIFGEFDVIHLDQYDPRTYVEAIEMLVRAGYRVIIIDSLSHAWAGKGGALELKDKATQRNGGNSYTAWSAVTPLQNQLIETIIGAPAHVIVTLRAKMDHVQEVNERGRTVIRKVGMAPIQRDGVEYEFDVVGELDIDNVMTITKTRNPEFKGLQIVRPTRDFGRRMRAWLEVAPPAGQPPAEEAASNLVSLPDRAAQTWTAPPAEGPRDVQQPAPPPDPEAEFAEGIADDPTDRVWWPMPGADAFKCQAVGCEQTYLAGDEIVYGGKRFRGRTLADRSIADAQKPLCAPHAKAWNEGVDVLSEEVAV